MTEVGKIGRNNKIKIIRQFLNWTRSGACEFDTAVNLTFRVDPRTREFASSQFGYFVNKLNDACYGNNWDRRAKNDPSAKLAVMPILEDGFGRKRLHYHCLFAKPTEISIDLFRLKINYCWGQTYTGGSKHNKIRPIHFRFGLINYITKEMSVTGFDKIDVDNTHIY